MEIIWIFILIIVQNIIFHQALMHYPEENEDYGHWYLWNAIVTCGIIWASIEGVKYAQNI